MKAYNAAGPDPMGVLECSVFTDGSATLEIVVLAIIVGATSFVGFYHMVGWLLRGRTGSLEPWVVLWSILCGVAIGLRGIQMGTQDLTVAKACLKWSFFAVLLLIPVLFRIGVLLAQGEAWRRAQAACFLAFGGLALVAPFTEAFVVEEGFRRTGLLGGRYFGFEAGPLVIPMMILIWVAYPTLFYVLVKGRTQGTFKFFSIATYTTYVLIGSLEILDGLKIIDAPGIFPYALFVQSLGLGVLSMMRQTETAKALMRTRDALRLGNETLDAALVQIRIVSKVRTRFIANMSHELRTPLNGVLGMAELLDHTVLDETQQHYVETLRSSGQGLLELIGDVLDFAKIDAGEMTLEERAFEVLPMVESCLRAVALQAYSKGLELALIPDPDMPSCVVGDETRVRQVVMNLLGNAVKFTDSGSVSVRIYGQENLIIQVQDTGIGISPDRQAALFQPFVQADDSTTRRFGGTGLGLSITEELVGAMGGSIQLDSMPGQGSSFKVCLPLPFEGSASPRLHLQAALVEGTALEREEFCARMPGISVESPLNAKLVFGNVAQLEGLVVEGRLVALIPLADERARERARELDFEVLSTPIEQEVLFALALGTQQRMPRSQQAPKVGLVLVVEDNLVNQMVLRHKLETLGFGVVLARNGQEALDRVAGAQLIIMDCQMPIMDGYQATRRLRKMGCELPIMGLSANALAGDAERALAAGMDRYQTKPVDYAKLKSILDELIPQQAV
ncbi:MAG: signal transduction histidine kinase [Cognaticolwellia sp.]